MDKGLFIFYLIFWVTGRAYILAGPYYHVKIYHAIGLHFNIICLVAYIVHVSTDPATKLFWKLFLLYSILSAFVYSKVQLSLDNKAIEPIWESGIKTSALSRIGFHLGFIQDIFVPAFIVFVIFLFYKLGLKSGV